MFNKKKVQVRVSGGTANSAYIFNVLSLDYNILFDDTLEKIKFDIDLSSNDDDYYLSIIEGHLTNIRLIFKDDVDLFASKTDIFNEYENDHLINKEGFVDNKITGLMFSFEDGISIDITLIM